MPLKFSGKLDIYRRLKGWTIAKMAEKIGVSSVHLEYLLTGKHIPLGVDVVRIERALDIRFEVSDFEDGIPGEI